MLKSIILREIKIFLWFLFIDLIQYKYTSYTARTHSHFIIELWAVLKDFEK